MSKLPASPQSNMMPCSTIMSATSSKEHSFIDKPKLLGLAQNYAEHVVRRVEKPGRTTPVQNLTTTHFQMTESPIHPESILT